MKRVLMHPVTKQSKMLKQIKLNSLKSWLSTETGNFQSLHYLVFGKHMKKY